MVERTKAVNVLASMSMERTQVGISQELGITQQWLSRILNLHNKPSDALRKSMEDKYGIKRAWWYINEEENK